jgi:hypothetical protein
MGNIQCKTDFLFYFDREEKAHSCSYLRENTRARVAKEELKNGDLV